MTDTEPLREALEQIARQKKTTELETEYDLEVADFEGGYDECIDVAHAALTAAPRPATDREALVEVIEQARERSTSSYAIADALLARGLRLPGNGARNRVQYDDNGLDEVVTDAGMHFERMSDNDWYLSGQRSDGSEIAIWISGKVTLVEERSAPPAAMKDGGA